MVRSSNDFATLFRKEAEAFRVDRTHRIRLKHVKFSSLRREVLACIRVFGNDVGAKIKTRCGDGGAGRYRALTRGGIPGPRRHHLTRGRTVTAMESPAARSPAGPGHRRPFGTCSSSPHNHRRTPGPPSRGDRSTPNGTRRSVSPNQPLTNATLHRQSRNTPSPASAPGRCCLARKKSTGEPAPAGADITASGAGGRPRRRARRPRRPGGGARRARGSAGPSPAPAASRPGPSP